MPISTQKPKEDCIKIIKEFTFPSNEELYILKLGKTNNDKEIYFNIIPNKNKLLLYEAKYTLDDLYKLSQSFRFFTTINDLTNAFGDMINNKKIIIEKNANDNTNIKLGIIMSNFLGKEEKILINLNLNELSEKEGNKKLLMKIIELEEKLLVKDKEIKLLNDKYSELEKRIKNLENKDKFYLKSEIIMDKNNFYFIDNRINPGKEDIRYDLIYKCDKNNDSPKIFHEKCDGKKNVLVLIETNENIRFGGYTSVGYNSTTGYTKDNDAFLFSIDKKKIYNVKSNKDAIYCCRIFGPCFSGNENLNIYIYGSNFLTCKCHTSKSNENCFEINYDYELNNSKYEFYIKKLEIFQIVKNDLEN